MARLAVLDLDTVEFSARGAVGDVVRRSRNAAVRLAM